MFAYRAREGVCGARPGYVRTSRAAGRASNLVERLLRRGSNWSIMEAGKARLAAETVRDADAALLGWRSLKRDNERLKQLGGRAVVCHGAWGPQKNRHPRVHC